MAKSTRLRQAELAAVLREQQGVITRSQAVGCGLSPHALAHRLRPGGPWQCLLPGTYLTVTGSPTQRQRELAAQLFAGPDGALTGLAALHSRGIVRSAPAVVDVLVPLNRRRRSCGFTVLHRTSRMPEEVVVDGGRRYVMVPRALADAARWCGDLREARALVAGAVQRGRCPLGLLVRELDRGPVRDSAVLRQVLAEVARGVRSVTEAEFVDLIRRGKLPLPLLNMRLYAPDGTFLACPDAWWPEAGVAAEVDSREWHLSPADWERTLRRHARMSEHGIIVLHFTPHQIRSDPAAVRTTIAGALDSGAARPPIRVTARPAAA
jgi:hypothetical protein